VLREKEPVLAGEITVPDRRPDREIIRERLVDGGDVAFRYQSLTVYVESASGTPSFLIDDFDLTFVPPPVCQDSGSAELNDAMSAASAGFYPSQGRLHNRRKT
jgi:hypothetical protein